MIIYIHIFIYVISLSHKKNCLVICDNMDGHSGYCLKWNNGVWLNLYMESKKKANEQTLNRNSDRNREEAGDCPSRVLWGGKKKKCGLLRGRNFQLQKKWILFMKYTVWRIYSIVMCHLCMLTDDN